VPGRALGRAGPEVGAAVGLAVVAVAAAEVRAGLLLVVVAAAAGVAAAELARDAERLGLNASPVLWAVAAVVFPLAVFRFRETGLAGAAAAVVVVAAGRWVLGRPARAAVSSIAAFVLAALYVGFCAAYLLLLQFAGGARLVLGAIVVVAAFHVARSLAETYLRSASLVPHLGDTPTLAGTVAGVAGAVLGVVLLLSLVHLPIRPRLVAEIGIAVACALTLGTLAWALMRPTAQPPRGPGDLERSVFGAGILSALQASLLAAPALYYALKLALR